ncbi:MAG TPA: GlxA family transcriptional regulator [Arenicellales bacterium]|nr:GlxA family transcriptional regulator [Arenicellales bacterium]
MPLNVGLLLVPEFSMMAFSAVVEPLRAANDVAGESVYRWSIFSADDEPVVASNGITISPTGKRLASSDLDYLFVCSGKSVAGYRNPDILRWLRQLAHRNTRIGSVSTGAFILARSGLLDGYRCTIHWESLPAFREEFPATHATRSVYEIDRDRYTCSGGTAAVDLMLKLITDDLGTDAALAVAQQFQHDRVRTSDDKQGNARDAIVNFQSPRLAAAVSLMHANIETPVTPNKIAAAIGLSLRQLERLFHKYCSSTPQKYYLALRLEHARRLLLETNMSILSASIAAGFASQSHFTKCYRNHFQRTPKQERARFFTNGSASRAGAPSQSLPAQPVSEPAQQRRENRQRAHQAGAEPDGGSQAQ